MKVNVGSANEIKVGAVRETIVNYGMFSGAVVKGVDVPSGVAEQPKTLNELITGAKNRAKNVFNGCDYSFGLESGLMDVPHTLTGCMNVCACVIYDGQRYHLGLSPAFEYPPEAIRLVREEGLDINQAFHNAGFTDNPKVGNAEGALGILTKGRVTRKDALKLAVQMALIHLENQEHYA